MFAQVNAETAAAVWSAEYWAHKGKVRLYVYRKRAAAPLRAGDRGRV